LLEIMGKYEGVYVEIFKVLFILISLQFSFSFIFKSNPGIMRWLFNESTIF